MGTLDTSKKPRLCLVMIVRNESRVIRRCLDRVKPYIDYWVIVDTGSDDNTMELIQQTLSGIPGELHQRTWVNFGVNRTESLQLAKNKAEYLLLCDADEQIIFSDDFKYEDLKDDSYLIPYQGALDYSVPYLLKGNLDWHYVGVTHEYLSCKQQIGKKTKISTLSILDLKDGGYKAHKYERDIDLLTKGLEEEPNNSRYKYYLACSYRDTNDNENASIWYQKRIDDGGWIEEVTCAYENLGLTLSRAGHHEKALAAWLKGYDYNPKRAECLFHAVEYLRKNNQPRLGYQLGLVAKAIPYPVNDVLFVKRNIYTLYIDYELSICAYYVKDMALGYQCCRNVLLQSVPKNISESTINNLRFYLDEAKSDTKENIHLLVAAVEKYLPTNATEQQLKTLASLKDLL